MHPLLHNKKLHFIGIGGCGMKPLARALKAHGHEISGSDSSPSSTKELRDQGFAIHTQQDGSSLSSETTVVYSSAIKEDNKEFLYAKQHNLQILHRSDLLSLLLAKQKSITVCGTHGKTTTTAMISHIFKTQNYPTLPIIGGKTAEDPFPPLKHPHYIIAEADESDGSFTKYTPSHSVVTNIDFEHPDYYSSYKMLFKKFENHTKNIPLHGNLIYNSDNHGSQELGKNHQGNKISYGLKDNSTLQATDYKFSPKETLFTVTYQTKNYRCRLQQFGVHNISNALASIAAGLCYDISPQASCEALSTFLGVTRRLELIHYNPSKNIFIYDDYAHNPEKIDSAIKALRDTHPHLKLHTVFQPHRYSRIKGLYNKFISAFKSADSVNLTPFCSVGEENPSALTLEKFSTDISLHSCVKTRIFNDFTHISNFLCRQEVENCIILTLGAGDIHKVTNLIKAKMLC